MSEQVGFLQQLPGGVCFTHGPYRDTINCPQWPKCGAGPMRQEFVDMGLQQVLRDKARDSRIAQAEWEVVEAAVRFHRAETAVWIEGEVGSDESAAQAKAEKPRAYMALVIAVDRLLSLRQEVENLCDLCHRERATVRQMPNVKICESCHEAEKRITYTGRQEPESCGTE